MEILIFQNHVFANCYGIGSVHAKNKNNVKGEHIDLQIIYEECDNAFVLFKNRNGRAVIPIIIPETNENE